MSKFESSPAVKEFLAQCKQQLKGGECIIAGVSGGPDSMALLYLFHRLEIDVVAVHCNYGLRGKASDQDQELVEKMCQMWQSECVSVRLNPDETKTENFQNWARKRRYQVFHDLQREYNAALIATAHHLDDQLETILQKILRGAGVPAWKGMDVLERDLFRPLLAVSKSEIMQFVQQFNIPYRIDGSNEESTYARNFLRHNWFPELNRLFPGWRENLLKLPERSAEFDLMADHILSRVSGHPVRLNREAFLGLDPSLRPVILHRFVERSGIDSTLSGGFLSGLNKLDVLQSGRGIQVAEGVFLERDREQFLLRSKTSGRGDFRGTAGREELLAGVMELDVMEISIEPFDGTYEKGTLTCDADKVMFPVTFRSWQEGDSFQPLGMSGSQLISDHLTNRKISSARKAEAKLLESFDGKLCAVIFPHQTSDSQIGTISESVRCSQETETVLIIRKK